MELSTTIAINISLLMKKTAVHVKTTVFCFQMPVYSCVSFKNMLIIMLLYYRIA